MLTTEVKREREKERASGATLAWSASPPSPPSPSPPSATSLAAPPPGAFKVFQLAEERGVSVVFGSEERSLWLQQHSRSSN